MTVQQYLEKINVRFKSGISTEHSYRGDLQSLLESLSTGVQITNEPTRIACGAPDYIITKKGIPVGYIEAKDIGVDLKSKSLKEQFERYRNSLSNLIITDYLDFHLFIDGELKTTVQIGRIEGNKIVPSTDKLEEFTTLIKDFCTYEGQTIKSSKKLAEMMAGKAKLLAIVIENALNADLAPDSSEVHEDANNTLREQLKAFQDILIHDITPKEFADIYAQTIAYGMFAARLHDPDLNTFSRVEAAERIPKSNPFLRKLFQYVAGYDLDSRIQWIVDALADIFRATDVRALISNFSKATQQQDPIIHFYETFLSQYDPKLRKARGVWYTPEPVVNFIVRAVDDILKTEFDLPQGLADNSKTKIKVEVQGKKVEQEVHRVQILDPATGTGTFLAEVIRQIHEKFKGQEGIWSNYVENHLIPRLNGFELLMASYAMAHLKLDLLLTETGYTPTKEQRFRVYLTNSLEEYHPETGTLFANWLSAEANEANRIKRDTPVMVVMGNPPYSGESANKGGWIMNLMEDYKKEPGSKSKLKEKNYKWLNDDYVKFIRFSQSLIEKTKNGCIAFINPHGYIDNPTFRGMRWSLLNAFNKIYIIDLHGNSNKKEGNPNGGLEENVFDIMQGVTINIFLRSELSNKPTETKVFHTDIFGSRLEKYEFLSKTKLENISFNEIKPSAPKFNLTNTNTNLEFEYNRGMAITDIFPVNAVGIVSKRDEIAYQISLEKLKIVLADFKELSENDIKLKYNISKESRDQKVSLAKNNIIEFGIKKEYLTEIAVKPFDIKYTYHTNKVRGFLAYPVYNLMKHFVNKQNVGLVAPRMYKEDSAIFISKNIIAHKLCSVFDGNSLFPLWIYDENDSINFNQSECKRTANISQKAISKFESKLKLKYQIGGKDEESFGPVDILDYVYAILHSKSYRLKYNEFLRNDFPKVPLPSNAREFFKFVRLGAALRQIHLFESTVLEHYITKYPIAGTNEVDKIKYTDNRVYINETQYFEGVPEVAWNFYIGGYQPAQKWLKDRKGRVLSFEDILHYQKIIVALTETDRLMREIDEVIK